MSRIFASFIEGYGNVIKLFVPLEQNDAKNLKRDWIQVGNYLRYSIKELEREVEEGSGESTGKERRKED